tara:strand:- start:1714 stop:2298 length:585 start_codon:yes stop_codon:yes gene_type:complete
VNVFFTVDPGLWVSGLAMFARSEGAWVLSGARIVAPARSLRHNAPRTMALALARAAQRLSGNHEADSAFADAPDVSAARTALWVVEHPVLRGTRRSTHADVRLLQEVSDHLAGLSGVREKVTPEAWKGQVPKAAHHGRILERLALGELKHLAPFRARPRSTQKNHPNLKEALDAVGVGLWRCGRMQGTKRPGAL